MSPSVAKTRPVDIGVFVPNHNGGWIASQNSPEIPGTYKSILEITLLAEQMGFDFALTPSTWRGYDGETRFSQVSLESVTAMAGLAQATSRIRIWATVHMMIWPPAIVAKMIATLDQIAPKRVGLNLVTGSNPKALSHMGLWRDLDHSQRYELGEEWIQLVRRLWAEDRVTHKGAYYETDDCMSYPKPIIPPTVVCAGMSERGFRFTVENCDAAFMTADDNEKSISRARRAKEIAQELRKPDFKTYGLVSLIPGATDREAEEKVRFYNEGGDRVALLQQRDEYASDVSAKVNSAARLFIDQGNELSAIFPGTMTGSPETLARRLSATISEGQLDGVMIIVPDFINDLKTFGEQIVPLMQEFGLKSNIRAVA